MNAYLIVAINFAVFIIIVAFFDFKFDLLRDISSANSKPYSLSKVQLAWWIVIIFGSITSILFKRGVFPTLDQSTLILLGIGSATSAAGRIIDLSDQNNANLSRHQDNEKEGFFLDILSDENGVSIHRLQTLIFNLILGTWFIYQVIQNIALPASDPNKIIPSIDSSDLVMQAISTATYITLKSSENKVQSPISTQPQSLSGINVNNPLKPQG
jgi:hypothetical protein